MKRIFLIVLDSVGAGNARDAELFGDAGAHTLKSVSESPYFRAENLCRAGLGNIEGLSFLGKTDTPYAAHARLRERSMGKDTTIGHWEIAGMVSERPLPTYPNGFPQELLEEFSRKTGRGVLCNKPYSGTEVIRDYGDEHVKTGDLIVYTSADSVFQIAAHEDVVPVETLYEYCSIARELLTGEHAVGRVIARPFVGANGVYTRTTNRRDFSLAPEEATILDILSSAEKDVISIGKIRDIFAGRGVTEALISHGNAEGMELLSEVQKRDFDGLCFANLVDFDMLYGHRNDIDGYAKALAAFDEWLPSFAAGMREDDLLLITADHGCDPGDISTDHTREDVPLLAIGKQVAPVNLGVRDSFADIAATIAELFGLPVLTHGKSFAREILPSCVTDKQLLAMAGEARKKAYAPYSGYTVGAALLCEDGTVYTGCNIENSSFSPTVCAERVAIFKAVADGNRTFSAIAVAGNKQGEPDGLASPCGVCRQVLAEFCEKDLRIVLTNGVFTLGELLPLAFRLRE